MNKAIKIILGLVLLVLVIGGAYKAYNLLSDSYYNNSIPSSTEGSDQKDNLETATDFTVTDGQGNDVSLSDFFGQPIVLNFWASWCPPCKAEFPEFQKVFTETKEEVQFLMINMTDGQRETVDTASAFIQENQYTFPVYYDTTQEAAYNYGIRSIPTTLFIDKDGYIVSAYQGRISESTLKDEIAKITSSVTE